jgi:hypothetical protein
MAKSLTRLTIFASGTSETESERSALRRVAEELNKQLEKTHAITLRVRAWPDDVRPGVNAYSQAELNHQLGMEYDIYLGVLGSRFGTPTPRAGSGTEEEFSLALAKLRGDSRSIRLLFYFKRSAEDPFSLDVDQLQRVRSFRERLGTKGVVYRDFHDTAEFVQQTREHLYNLIVDEWTGDAWGPIEDPKDTVLPSGMLLTITVDGNAEAPPTAALLGNDSEALVEDHATSDGAELGFLDHMEQFYEAVPALLQTFEVMSGHTSDINDRVLARTAETNALQHQQESLGQVGGSRTQQEYVSKMKQIVNHAADDLDDYADRMSATLNEYRMHSRAMLGNFRAALQAAGHLWSDETKSENRVAVTNLFTGMESTLAHIAQFQATIKGIPALTGKFKKARNHAAGVLGELIAEITFSAAEAKQIAAELAGTAIQLA